MAGTLRLGRLTGIEVRVHASWLLLIALVSWSLAMGYFPSHYPGLGTDTTWLLGILGALLLVASILAHELSHAWVARAHGVPVHSVTLFIFGGLASLAGDVLQPRVEFLIAAAGPAMSLLLAALCYLAGFAVQPVSDGAAALLGYLALINLVLALFNLLPGTPLDGGRLLHAAAWRVSGSATEATRIAAVGGQLVAYGLIFVGMWQILSRDVVGGLWLILIGWFVQSAARGSVQQATVEQQLATDTVEAAMQPNPITVPVDTSLRQAIDDYMLPHNLDALPVVDGDRWMGIVSLQDILRVPAFRWRGTAVIRVMRPREAFAAVVAGESLTSALDRLAARPKERLPVTADDRLVGIVSRDDMLRYLRIRLALARAEQNSAPVGPARQPLG
jgi:Zn-dependent protease/CBS domain-containing protein